MVYVWHWNKWVVLLAAKGCCCHRLASDTSSRNIAWFQCLAAVAVAELTTTLTHHHTKSSHATEERQEEQQSKSCKTSGAAFFVSLLSLMLSLMLSLLLSLLLLCLASSFVHTTMIKMITLTASYYSVYGICTYCIFIVHLLFDGLLIILFHTLHRVLHWRSTA